MSDNHSSKEEQVGVLFREIKGRLFEICGQEMKFVVIGLSKNAFQNEAGEMTLRDVCEFGDLPRSCLPVLVNEILKQYLSAIESSGGTCHNLLNGITVND